jgi:hypothetical protein
MWDPSNERSCISELFARPAIGEPERNRPEPVDGSTEAAARQSFHERAAQEVERSRRLCRPLRHALINPDHLAPTDARRAAGAGPRHSGCIQCLCTLLAHRA